MTREAPDSSSSPRLRMQGVSKAFGATVALSGVDLEVRAGEVLALVGENGAGKSTLMKVLSGAHQPDEGRMWLDGAIYQPRDPADGRAAGVAMIYQELSLAQHLSTAENVLLGVEPRLGPFVRRRELRRRAADAMREIGRPDIPLGVPVGRFSVAEQQLIEIARSVATGCRVLVLDEPTSSLAHADIERLFALVRRLRDSGHAIVYISHVLEEVKEISNRFAVLRDGALVGGGETSTAAIPEIVAMMVGREVSELYPRSERQRGEVVLSVSDLAGIRLPTAASLDLYRGEIVGIAGLVGAGRTEFMRSIFGLDLVRRGTVRVGTYSGGASPARRWSQGVGMVSEDRKREGLAVNLSIADNMTMARLPRFVSPTGQRRSCGRWIERMQLRCAGAAQPVDALSGGNQQKVAIARLLHADSDVLLLDEPTRGIDVGSKAQIYQLIDDLAVGDAALGRRPRAVLMISSYLPELIGVCDRIAVMCRGALGPARPVGELDEHRIMLEATGAGAAI